MQGISMNGILDNNESIVHLLRLVICLVIMHISASTVRSLESNILPK